jgi:hypothetical protein
MAEQILINDTYKTYVPFNYHAALGKEDGGFAETVKVPANSVITHVIADISCPEGTELNEDTCTFTMHLSDVLGGTSIDDAQLINPTSLTHYPNVSRIEIPLKEEIHTGDEGRTIWIHLIPKKRPKCILMASDVPSNPKIGINDSWVSPVFAPAARSFGLGLKIETEVNKDMPLEEMTIKEAIQKLEAQIKAHESRIHSLEMDT